jgi:TolB-like protein/Flp pilus assembly protein TadD
VISTEPDKQAIFGQLERVLSSPGFARNERLSRFLRFVVERHLAGRDGELKETVIATEVFGRPADYNPKRDAVVRTEAGRLRSRLSEYYSGQGVADSLIIDLPKGGYVPAFRCPDTLPPPDSVPPARRHRRRLFAMIAAAGVAVAGLAWWTARRAAPISIAVLPLENLSHDTADDYLADGLSDELIRTLSTFSGVAPRSRTSSFALKGKGRNAREAGAILSVDYVVEGSVLHSGDQVRVDAQLVRVRDDVSIWSGKFERKTSNVLEIQDEISRTIVNNLPIKLGPVRKRREVNPEAYDRYLRALSLGLLDRVSPLREAIGNDPTFALAYAGLAGSYAYRTGNSENDLGELREMRAAAEKAIELDPLLPEAQSALGMSYARDGKWALAEKSFQRAIELNPNRSETYGDFSAYVLLEENRVTEALALLRTAEKSDPLSPEVRSELAYVLLTAHRYDEAATQCEKLPDNCNCWPAPREPMRSECLGRARLGQGRFKEAIEIFAPAIAKATRGAPIRGYLAYAYGRAGMRDQAQQIIDADWKNPYHQALGFLGIGEKDRAIDALLRMALQGPTRMGVALVVPELDSIRDDPRMKDVRKKAGLP